MQTAPKSMRLQIGIFGRTNVGKSSFLNLVTDQDISIVSSLPGTTTDVVEKVMELLPVGPVVFLDTAGIDDVSRLSSERVRKTEAVFSRADVYVLITENGAWGEYEQTLCAEARKRNSPVIIIVNKTDLNPADAAFLKRMRDVSSNVITCSCVESVEKERVRQDFRDALTRCVPEEFLQPPALVGDLLPPDGLAVLIVPIDLQAPKGRLILPQVQTIRDALDNDASVLVVKEREYASALAMLNRKPDIVICDSQVVLKMTADTPEDIACTTFSILFARFKGDLIEAARGAATIERLKKGDRVLIAEACSHHAAEDDIGRVKIPRWLRQYTGLDLDIDVCSGRDYPLDLEKYSLVIHCGACMLTRREMLSRSSGAAGRNVPITNYGVAISCLQGVIRRVLKPFPAAYEAFCSQEIASRV
ncbi:MAG: [FeFe] hydrogenase H-cluster maturation GTPase HydF [Chitinispirillaceae bacterium]